MFREIQASKKSLENRGLVHGVGVNDASYMTELKEGGKRFTCPYYSRWSTMLGRCYSKAIQKEKTRYVGCKVCQDWLTFSKFKSWMEKQDWEGKELDKDILVPGNKVYSPETCAFVPQEINKLLSRGRKRNFQQGVYLDKRTGRYRAAIRIGGRNISLGTYSAEDEARTAYIQAKKARVSEIANTQKKHIRIALLQYAERMAC